MNPLVHTKLNLMIIEENNIHQHKEQIIIGGLLPDISTIGIIPEKESHNKSLKFMTYLQKHAPELTPLGFGFILHGEHPKGLDYYTHNTKGYIAVKTPEVSGFVKELKPNMTDQELDMLSHSFIEFVCDTFVEKIIANEVNYAFRKMDAKTLSYHIGGFFGSEYKRVYKVLRFFRHFNFRKLSTVHGSINAWNFLSAYKNSDRGLSTAWGSILASLNLVKKHRLKKTFLKIKEVVNPDFEEFFSNAYKGVNSLVKQKKYHKLIMKLS